MATMRFETYDGETGAILSVETIDVPDPEPAASPDWAAMTPADVAALPPDTLAALRDALGVVT